MDVQAEGINGIRDVGRLSSIPYSGEILGLDKN